MINYINNLKTKPEHIKKRFAVFVSSGFTFFVLFVWIASYGITNNSIISKNDVNNENIENTEKNKVAIETPAKSLTATAINTWNDLKSIFVGSNKVEFTNDSVEITAGSR